MQVGQSVLAATFMVAPSVAKASFRRAKRASFFAGAPLPLGAEAVSEPFEAAGADAGRLAEVECAVAADAESRCVLAVIPFLATAADSVGANTPSTNTYRA